MKTSVTRRSRPRHRPIDVEVDFILSSDDNEDLDDTELVFLSRDVESEVQGQEYVAVMASSSREAGWSIFRVGVWEEKDGKLMGRRVVISGVSEEVRRRLGGRVLLQGVTPAPLETVVIKVSEQDYDIVSDDHDTFQQLRLAGMVFRAGKTIFTSNNVKLKVTLSEPVRQGILGEDTEIILVTDDNDHRDIHVNGLGTPFSVSSQNDSDLDISQFLALPSSETDIDFDTVTEETSLIPPEDDPNSRGIPLRVCVLQRPVDRFSLDPRPTESEDDEFRVYAHMRDIAHIGVFSGDWVPISSPPPSKTTLIIDFSSTTPLRRQINPFRKSIHLTNKPTRPNPRPPNTLRQPLATNLPPSPHNPRTNYPPCPSNPRLPYLFPRLNRQIPRVSIHIRPKTTL